MLQREKGKIETTPIAVVWAWMRSADMGLGLKGSSERLEQSFLGLEVAHNSDMQKNKNKRNKEEQEGEEEEEYMHSRPHVGVVLCCKQH